MLIFFAGLHASDLGNPYHVFHFTGIEFGAGGRILLAGGPLPAGGNLGENSRCVGKGVEALVGSTRTHSHRS